jgi:hypothetical protein
MEKREQQFRQAAGALYERDADRAASLVAEGAAVDVDQIAREVERRAAVRAAANALLDRHPEIRADRDLQILADSYIAAHLANGEPLEKAIAEAGEQVMEKFVKRKAPAPDKQDVMAEEDPSAVIRELAKSRGQG